VFSEPFGFVLNWFYSLNPFVAAVISVIITPVGFFLAGIIGESRIIHPRRSNNISVIPGQLLLSALFGLSVYSVQSLPANSWQGFWGQPAWQIVGLILVIIFIASMRLTDSRDYNKTPRATSQSPTKWYNDVIGYGVYTYLIGIGAIPALLFWHSTVVGISMIAIFMTFGVIVMVDLKNCSSKDRAIRHPSGRQPIWKTKHIDRA